MKPIHCVRTEVATFLGLAFAAGITPLAGQETVELRGDHVALHNVAGEVTLRSGSGSAVRVSIRRGGADATRLAVEVRDIGGRQTLVIEYPGDHVVYPRLGRGSRTQVHVNREGLLYRGDRQVMVRGSGSGVEAWADLEITVPSGRAFDLHQGVGEVEATGISADLTLDVSSGPVTASSIRGELAIDTGSGRVEVRNLEGSLHVDTGSGSVIAEDIVGDQVMVDTGSGGVEVGGARAARVMIDTGSGGVRLRSITSPSVGVDTGSGSVEIELLGRVDDVVVDTGSGSVTLYVPDTLDARIEVDTGSGGIDVDFPLDVVSAERSHLRARIGSGRGDIKIDTGSGGVRLIRR